MIEETATVIRCEDGVAWIEAQRQSTCQACAANKACGTAVLASWLGRKAVHVRAINTLGAKPGEQVRVGMQESALLSGSLRVYLLPIVLMLVFAMLGSVVAEHLLWSADITSVVFAIAGLLLAALLLRRFTRQIANDVRYQPIILQRLGVVPSTHFTPQLKPGGHGATH